MKHHSIFLFCLLFISHLSAQPLLELKSNIMRPEDKLIKQQVQFINPGESGKNVFWDFSQQEPVDTSYKLDYF